jgi:hypothetical protein
MLVREENNGSARTDVPPKYVNKYGEVKRKWRYLCAETPRHAVVHWS